VLSEAHILERPCGHYPLKVEFHGGFAFKENPYVANAKGVKDVCFAMKRGLKEKDTCRSPLVQKRLRRFRPKRSFLYGH